MKLRVDKNTAVVVEPKSKIDVARRPKNLHRTKADFSEAEERQGDEGAERNPLLETEPDSILIHDLAVVMRGMQWQTGVRRTAMMHMGTNGLIVANCCERARRRTISRYDD
ncbi:hypothetical protein RBSH_04429 [Rhodopirellula baltica SH28]|uniref:Uncharacterized protein n=1 Tax=Rhodopirellula baltica SH28 TaxID=993517 RepID=K5DBU9_RHOBT|nr:hypothetical protein RBSH_04429 [Rhodopirellula baltica SH28]